MRTTEFTLKLVFCLLFLQQLVCFSKSEGDYFSGHGGELSAPLGPTESRDDRANTIRGARSESDGKREAVNLPNKRGVDEYGYPVPDPYLYPSPAPSPYPYPYPPPASSSDDPVLYPSPYPYPYSSPYAHKREE